MNVNHDTDTVLEEQFNDSVIDMVRNWLKNGIPAEKYYTVKQSKALQAYIKNLKALILDSQYDNSVFSKSCEDGSFDVRTCAPLSLLIKTFEVANTHKHSSHRVKTTTYNRVKQYFF